MINRTIRHHTPDEIAKLSTVSPFLQFSLSGLLGVSFLSAVLYGAGGFYLGVGIDYLVSQFISSYTSRFFTAFFCTLGLIWTFMSMMKSERSRRKSLKAEKDRSESALSDGRVEVIECNIDSVAQLEEYEDEGPGYFLQVVPGLLLFVQSQEFEYEAFPGQDIVVTRDVHTHRVLDFKYSGRPIEPTRNIKSQQFGGTEWLQYGMFIRGNINDLPDEAASFPQQDDVLDEVIRESKIVG